MIYFNEFDAFAAQWLRNLYPHATVDERSIKDVKASDLVGYERVHLFGGIAGWQYALDLAGWIGPVWTGSCPCQPFSAAGKRKGAADKRHLWPEMFRLIRECRPPVVFGEQTPEAIKHGWLDGVFDDLETCNYACGAVVLPAAAVGAKHIRRRIWFVANTVCEGLEGIHEERREIRLQPVKSPVPEHEWKATPRVLQRVDGFSRKLDKPPAYRETISCYGNAIVPQIAAEFIKAVMECI